LEFTVKIEKEKRKLFYIYLFKYQVRLKWYMFYNEKPMVAPRGPLKKYFFLEKAKNKTL
jgi:hypothetical protein